MLQCLKFKEAYGVGWQVRTIKVGGDCGLREGAQEEGAVRAIPHGGRGSCWALTLKGAAHGGG